ncbi:MAG: efflux RND transporter permease subunit, partial [bacterium]
WQETKKNLPLVVIISLFLIFFMVYLVFYNFWEVGVVFYLLPLALIGCLVFLDYFGFKLSIASVAGIVSTMGIAVEMMIVMMIYIRNSLIFTKGSVYEKVYNGAVKRLRPKVMTVVILIFSLIPIVLSEGMGSEVLKPIVVPMIGGAVSSFLVALFCIPSVYLLKGKKLSYN